MRWRRVLAAVASIAILTLPAIAHADVNDFTVTDFNADYCLTNTDPQGSMAVVERMSVNFTDFNHGFLRVLPDSYKGLPLHVHVDSITSETGAPTTFTTSSSN